MYIESLPLSLYIYICIYIYRIYLSIYPSIHLRRFPSAAELLQPSILQRQAQICEERHQGAQDALRDAGT